MFKSVGNYFFAALLFVLVLVMCAPGRALALSGGFSCLGTFSLGVNVGTSTAPQWRTVPFSELIHLNIAAAGGPPGTLTVNWFGEVCTFNITSLVVAVNATGQGTMSIGFNPNIGDQDKDAGYNCGLTNWGRNTPIIEHYLISTANSSTKFFFIGSDDFITPPTSSDNGDFFSVSGECDHQ